jgi:hypothetical protein
MLLKSFVYVVSLLSALISLYERFPFGFVTISLIDPFELIILSDLYPLDLACSVSAVPFAQ